jgi:hypothetical protein
MKLLSLDLPDDPKGLARWLEAHLLSTDFARLVTELSAVQSESAPVNLTVRQVLGAWLPRVLQEGLCVVPPSELRRLLKHPPLLAELQELVLIEGGPYWDRVAASAPELKTIAERGRLRFDEFLQTASSSPTVEPGSARRQAAWQILPWIVSFTMAACVLIGVFAIQSWRASAPAATTWGWSKPDAMPANVTAATYLHALADGADEWFSKRPDDSAALAKRLGEMRQGCSQLIFAEHLALSDVDRDWLREKCRDWAAKLDAQRVALEAGASVQEVRAQADQIVTNLAAALRAKAKAAV